MPKPFHTTSSEVSTRTIWKDLKNGHTSAEIADQVALRYLPWTLSVLTDLLRGWIRLYDETWPMFCSILTNHMPQYVTREDDPEAHRANFERTISDREPDLQAILLAHYDDQGINDAIWKSLKPELETPESASESDA